MAIESLDLDDPLLARSWQATYDANPTLSPFHSYSFAVEWARQYAHDQRCAALTWRAHDESIVILVLRHSLGRWRTLFDNCADYTGAVYSTPAGDAPRELALAMMADAEFDGTTLWNIVDDDPVLAELLAAGRAHRTDRQVAQVANAAEVPSLIEYPHGDSYRRQARQDLRRLNRLGVNHVDVRGHDVLDLVEDVFRLHTATWRARGQPGKFADERRRRLVRSLVVAHDLECRLSGFTLNGELIAYRFGFLRSGCEYFWNSGFAPEFGQYSPGTALLLADTSRLFEPDADPNTIDFLRGEEAYKLQWSTSTRGVGTYVITNADAGTVRARGRRGTAIDDS